MNFQEREYDGLKPALFPLRMDLRFDKKWELDDNLSTFDTTLNEKLSNIVSDEGGLNQKTSSEQKKMIQQLAVIAATIQAASLQKGLDHLPMYAIGLIQQSHNAGNFEKSDGSQVDFSRLLQIPLSQINQESIEKLKKKNSEKYQEYLTDKQKKLKDNLIKVQGYSQPHTFNLYHGMASLNPFSDQESATLFQKESVFKMYTDQFMSPLSVMGSSFFQSANEGMKKIQEKMSSLDNIPGIYTDVNQETLSIQGNYNTVLTDPKIWQNWNPSQYASFLTRRWSDVRNFYKVINSLSGKAYDQYATSSKIEAVSNKNVLGNKMQEYLKELDEKLNQLSTQLKEIQKNPESANTDNLRNILTQIKIMNEELSNAPVDSTSKSEIEKRKFILDQMNITEDLKKSKLNLADPSLKEVKQWWKSVGSQLPSESMLLPVGLMAQVAGDISEQMTIANWDRSLKSLNASEIQGGRDGFIDKAIQGYSELIKKEFMPQLENIHHVYEANFPQREGFNFSVYTKLQEQGFVGDNGVITSKFDPGKTNQIAIYPNQEEWNLQIEDTLRKASMGPLDFEMVDVSSKTQILLNTPDKKNVTMQTLLNWMTSEGPAEQRYTKMRDAYNVLFDMYESMTGLNVKSEAKLDKPNLIPLEDNKVGLTVYPHASWVDPKSVNNEKKVEDKPLMITFSSEQEAMVFFDKIKLGIAMLEPVLGSFNPSQQQSISQTSLSYQNGVKTEMPLRILCDNQGNIGENGLIQKNSEDYKVFVDTLYLPSHFKTEHWNKISQYLDFKVTYKMGESLFSKTAANQFGRTRHKREIENYEEEKKKFDNEEYERLLEEKKEEIKKLKEQQQEEKLYREKKQAEKEQLRLEQEKAAELAHLKRLQELKEQMEKAKKDDKNG